MKKLNLDFVVFFGSCILKERNIRKSIGSGSQSDSQMAENELQPRRLLVSPLHGAIAALSAVCVVLFVVVIAVILVPSGGVPEKTATWELVETSSCNFRCPPSMELRRSEVMKTIASKVNEQA